MKIACQRHFSPQRRGDAEKNEELDRKVAASSRCLRLDFHRDGFGEVALYLGG